MFRRLCSLLVMLAMLAVPGLVWSSPASAETRIVCAGQTNVPTGWIHTNSFFTPFACGAGATPVAPTQWEITRFDNLFRGDRLAVCNSAPQPTGWTTIERTFVPYWCGAGNGAGWPAPQPNVRLIECLNCPVRPPNPTPTPVQGSLDAIFPTGIAGGWARDPGNLNGSVTVHFYVDGPAGVGRFVGSAVANQFRSDVGQHAFNWQLPADLFDDQQHTLHAYGLDLGTDPPQQLANSPKTFRLPNRPIGSFEGIDAAGTARGWSLDPSLESYAQPNRVRFLVDGFTVGETTADLPRSDVQQSTGYPGDHGFRWPIPVRFRDGATHTLSVVGVDLTGNPDRELTGSPRTFQLTRTASTADVDGDRSADIGLWRPSTGTWWLMPSGTPGSHYAVSFGLAGDRPVPADYDGDGRTDVAVFRPSDGTWYVQPSGGGGPYGVAFGLNGDRPVPGDYDGDGRADLAVFRPSDSTWYVQPSSGGNFYGVPFGLAGDQPVPGDYDGDRRTDIAVYRPVVNAWFILLANGQSTVVQYGQQGDLVAPADYDGDTLTDIAVYRPSNGTWYIHRSLDGRDHSRQWGLTGDRPAPADYDGDGAADLAVFRPSNGAWYIVHSSTGANVSTAFGAAGDIPLAGATLP